MTEDVQTSTIIDDEEQTEFWSMYPQDVYLATTASRGGGFSLQNKKIIALISFATLTALMTIMGFFIAKKYEVELLGGAIGLITGVIVSLFLYSKLLRDKFNEDFESDTKNKILKLFRIRLNDLDLVEKVADKATLMSYTNGDVFVTLRLEIGNSSPISEEATEKFLSSLFKSAHQLNLGIKNYNIKADWKKSDVHHNHLKRLTKVEDSKLKATLASLDAHQSKFYENSKVLAIHIMFITKKNNLHALDALVRKVEDWRADYLMDSSIRTLDWLEREDTVEALCNFLTVQMLDVTSSLNKANVKYDIRKLVRVYSKNKFSPTEDVEIETKASLIRKRKG